jgi:archaeosortase C (PEF-CTERM variant)
MASLDRLLDFMRRRKYVWLLVWFLIFLAGLDLVWNPPKGAGPEYLILGVFFLALGLIFLILILVPKEKLRIEVKEGNLATALLHYLTVKGRLKPFFPVIGAVLIIVDILYNVFLSATPALLTHDTIVILFGAVMIAYKYIPSRFERERDFVFLFFVGLVLILVIPLMVARALAGNFDEGVGMYSAYFLVPELTGFLNLIGITASVDVSDPLLIHFTAQSQDTISVYISTACSGIYSFSIFASAFIAFVLTEYNKIDRKVGLLMVLGILTAYVANILRMVVIVLVGYYTYTPQEGLQAMLVAHSNAGWIIFLVWIGLFWFLMYRFLMRKKKPLEEKAPEKPGVKCGICGEIMKVDIPGIRCECGQFLHTECVQEVGKCPRCSADLLSQKGATAQEVGS